MAGLDAGSGHRFACRKFACALRVKRWACPDACDGSAPVRTRAQSDNLFGTAPKLVHLCSNPEEDPAPIERVDQCGDDAHVKQSKAERGHLGRQPGGKQVTEQERMEVQWSCRAGDLKAHASEEVLHHIGQDVGKNCIRSKDQQEAPAAAYTTQIDKLLVQSFLLSGNQ